MKQRFFCFVPGGNMLISCRNLMKSLFWRSGSSNSHCACLKNWRPIQLICWRCWLQCVCSSMLVLWMDSLGFYDVMGIESHFLCSYLCSLVDIVIWMRNGCCFMFSPRASCKIVKLCRCITPLRTSSEAQVQEGTLQSHTRSKSIQQFQPVCHNSLNTGIWR